MGDHGKKIMRKTWAGRDDAEFSLDDKLSRMNPIKGMAFLCYQAHSDKNYIRKGESILEYRKRLNWPEDYIELEQKLLAEHKIDAGRFQAYWPYILRNTVLEKKPLRPWMERVI